MQFLTCMKKAISSLKNPNDIISVEMNETSERGPEQWALETDLLKDPKFLEEVEDQ